MKLSKIVKRVKSLLKEKKLFLDDETAVGQATLWSLEGGKCLRPAIVYFVSEALKDASKDQLNISVDGAALAIEMLHTSSLIADDMPSMDNDLVRRGKEATHAKFGEAVAYLASYRLIAASYHCLAENGKKLAKTFPDAMDRYTKALQILSLKSMEITTGQFYDLNPEKSTSLDELIALKTTSLFQAAFALGWLFGGGAMEKLDDLEKAAYHFGQAFQIADDLDDASHDLSQNAANWAGEFGVESAIKDLKAHIKNAEALLEDLGIFSEDIRALTKALYTSTSSTSALTAVSEEALPALS